MKTEDLWPEILWCIKTAKVSQQHNDKVSMAIPKGFTPAMKSRLMLFFKLNYSMKTGDGYIIKLDDDVGTIAFGTEPYHFSATICNNTYSRIKN